MAITGKQFWDQFLDLLEPGNRTSSSDYYLPKSGSGAKAQSGEWGNVITQLFKRTAAGSAERQAAVDLLDSAGFWAPTDDKDFWVNQETNSADVSDLVNAAEQRFPDMFDAQGNSTNPGGSASSNEPTDTSPGAPPTGAQAGGEGGATTVPGIASGGTFTRINRQGQDDLWGYTYVVNGIEHVYTFDSFEAAESILGKNPIASGQYGFMTIDESSLNDGDTWLLGDAAAFAGQTGSYQTYFNDIMQEAALEAGVRNPGKLGEYFAQPEVQRIIAEGQAGGWSEARIQAELRNTDYYQNTLYPGISKIMATGTSNPENEWYNYRDSVESSLEMLGYPLDPDGTYSSIVGEMLESGIVASSFNTFAPTFVRAEQSQDFAQSLDYWTQQELGKSLDFEDWFDVLEGTASSDMMEVVEKATLQFQANQTRLGVSENDISRIAANTSFSEAQIAAAFSDAEQKLLAIGDNNLERYGLTQSMLANSAFGLESDQVDPFSTDGQPLTANMIQQRAQKAATELGLQDDRKAQFFVGFTPAGRPERQGLQAAAPEVG